MNYYFVTIYGGDIRKSPASELRCTACSSLNKAKEFAKEHSSVGDFVEILDVFNDYQEYYEVKD